MCCTGGCCYSLSLCSENVGDAAEIPQLCSSCLTGTVTDSPALPCISTTSVQCTQELQPVGVPGTTLCGCEDIYGSTTPTFTCSHPCSPNHCGSTDPVPDASCKCSPSAGCKCKNSPKGGGSGAGSAGSAGSGIPRTGNCANTSKLLASLSKLGTSMTSLLGGGQTVPVNRVVTGQAPTACILPGISSNTFLLVIIIVGILLLMMAFGRGRD